MLSSIHPLGERARRNRWGWTVVAFSMAATAAAAVVGTVLGGIGAALHLSSRAALTVVGAAAIAAAFLDLAAVPAPGPKRQVNERWIGVYRGWVYGAGFGAQLGAGLATYVVTWTVWVVFLAELLSGGSVAGAAIGAAFGIGRAIPVAAGGWIDRPGRLVTMSRAMDRAGRMAHRGLAVGVLAISGVAIGMVVG